jgi:hypothetical protein
MKYDEIVQENGTSLTLIPGNMHDAKKFIRQRGGMAFEADAVSPWIWHNNSNFRPKRWRVAFRATDKQNSMWQYDIDYPWKK